MVLNVLPRVEIKLQISKYAYGFVLKLINKSNFIEQKIPFKVCKLIEAKIMELAEKINTFVQTTAFDNAISEQAAKIKNIKNEVAGNADILLVPNIETGNSLSKIMVYFMNACAAGIVIGGKTPVVVPSRADSKNSKLASIMAAVVATQN